MTLLGPYFIACALLIVAGASKAARPANTTRALTTLFGHPRVLATAVPLVAAGEFLLGTAAIMWPIPALASTVALSYIAFAAVIIVLRTRHAAVSTCGCFGTPDTPATWLHAVINIALAASCLVVAIQAPGRNTVDALKGQPLHGVPLILAALVGTWLVVIAFTSLAQLAAVRQTLATRPGGPRS